MPINKTVITTITVIIIFFLVVFQNIHLEVKHNTKSLAQILDLTPQQIEYENLIRAENIKETKPILNSIEVETKKYKFLVSAKYRSNTILKQKKKIDLLYVSYNDLQSKHMHKFEEILTSEQKQKFQLIKTQLFFKSTNKKL